MFSRDRHHRFTDRCVTWPAARAFRERRAACVSEQVQHLGQTSRCDHLPAVVVDEIPVGRLLREDPPRV